MITAHIDPAPVLASPGLAAVLSALPQARLVGGAVRDAVLGIAAADIDLATPRTPQEVMAALRAAGLKGVPTGIAHGTVTAVAAGRGFEVTTLRRDVETDGRHAVVAFTDDWQADAARRDFTFNALSMTPDGTVFDYFAGLDDLRAGRLRFVGDPAARLAEDRLRTLRYFRFYARYAAEPPDGPTQAALRAAAGDLDLLSVERIWAELKRILAAPDPRAALALMRTLGVLDAVLPEAGDLAPLAAMIDAGAPADPLLRLAALLRPEAPNPTIRLRASLAETQRIDMLLGGPAPAAGDDDAAVRRALAGTPADILIGRAWLAGEPAALRARLAAMRRPRFPIEGRDLLALGFAPGPEMGATLARLRSWWMDGGCVASHAECLAALPAAGSTPQQNSAILNR